MLCLLQDFDKARAKYSASLEADLLVKHHIHILYDQLLEANLVSRNMMTESWARGRRVRARPTDTSYRFFMVCCISAAEDHRAVLVCGDRPRGRADQPVRAQRREEALADDPRQQGS